MKKKAVGAIVLAGLVALQMPMVAMADVTNEINNDTVSSQTEPISYDASTNTITVDDNVTVTEKYRSAVYLTSKNANINGNAKNSDANKAAVLAYYDITVNVSGSVTNNNIGNAINANSGAKVTADSAKNDTGANAYTTVYAYNGSNVNVKNEVTNEGQGYALYAVKGSTITAGSATSGKKGSDGSETVYATGKDTTITVNGTVTNKGVGKGIVAENSAAVTAGSVEASQGGAVYVIGGATVTVNGDVKNNSDLHATIVTGNDNTQSNRVTVNGGNVVAAGTKSAIDNGKGTVIVKKGDNADSGNVISSNDGSATVIVREGTTTVIEGTVINNGFGRGVYSIGGATIEVGGIQALSGTGIKVAEAGTIIVDGDVEAKNGIIIDDEEEIAKVGDAVIAINGELNISGTAINAQSTKNANNAVIYVYGVTSNGDSNLVTTDAKYDKANLNYIIHGSDGKANYSHISAITGDTVAQTIEIDGDKYYSSKQGVISVTLNDGYELSTGATIISVKGNTYVVNVPEGGHVTLAAIKKAIEEAERAASFTGTADQPITGGSWNCGPGEQWTFRTDGIFKNTWGNITLANGRTGWFYFDKDGIMQTGWKQINGKWYYFNEAHDGTYGMMLSNTTTPDGYRVGEDGALIQ